MNIRNKIKFFILMTGILHTLSGCASNGIQLLAPIKFGELTETDSKINVIDVRTPDEYAEGHLPGAVNIDALEETFVRNVEATYPSGSSLAIYCRSGRRSAEAAEKLEKANYRVADLDGGIMAWEKAGLPVTIGKEDLYFTKSGKNVKIEPLIHASIRITFGEVEIEVDPVGALGSRHTDYSLLPKADLILVTHEHHDHLDPAAITTLSKEDTTLVVNQRVADILGYGKVMANGDRLTLSEGIEIEAVAAYNITPEHLQFHPKGRDNGYILTLDGLRIYIAGDTEVTPEMHGIKDIDIAFLPCNQPYTMTPDQLIEAAKIIKSKVVYPYHFGDTDLSSLPAALAPEGIYVRICPFDP